MHVAVGLFIMALFGSFTSCSLAEQKKIKPTLLSKPINLVIVPLESTVFEDPPRERLKELQQKLWKNGVPLNPAAFYPWPQAKKPALDEKKWGEFKKNFDVKRQAVFQKMMENRDHISYQELKRGLASLLKVFDDLVQGDFSLGLKLNKSTHWVASLAVPHLARPPKDAFDIEVDTISNPGTSNSLLIRDYKVATSHLLIFDDASYSGAQMASVLEAIMRHVKHCRITVFIPFISESALKKLQELEGQVKASHNIITIVTTNRKLVPLNSAITLDELNSLLTDEPKSLKISSIQQWERKIRYNEMMLSFTDWKIPDGVSFPDFLIAAQYLKKANMIYGYNYIADSDDVDEVDCTKPDRDCFFPSIIVPYKNVALSPTTSF